MTETATVALVYFLLARLGQTLAIEPGEVTPLWPASGFALAVVLCRGCQTWVGIWVGSFLSNAWAFLDTGRSVDTVRTLMASLAIGPGDVCQALLGAYLIGRICTNGDPFGQTRDVFRFVGIELIVCLSSATIGILVVCVGGVLPWSSFGDTWLTWYLGDTLGVILVAPLLLNWRQSLSLLHSPILAFEAATVLVLTLFTSFLAFGGIFRPSLIFLPLPLVLWAAVRGGQFAVAFTVLGVWGVALWDTYQGRGPFTTEDHNVSLGLLQVYAAVTLITGLAVTSALTERRRVERMLRKTNQALFTAQEDLRLAAVAFNTHDSIMITDELGNILRVNQGFTELTGYDADNVAGKTPAILKSGRHDEGFYLDMWASIRTHGHWEGEVWNRRKDGHIYLQRLTITSVKNRFGKITHYIGDGQDITEARLAAADRAAINAAREVQESLYPSEPPCVPGFDIAGAVHPAAYASGDYFDFLHPREGCLGILVADVCSHGLGPALLMAQIQAYIRSLTDFYDDPARIINHANRLFTSNRAEHFVTLFLCHLDLESHSLVYAAAGHQGYLVSETGEVKVLASTGPPMGIDAALTVSSAPVVLMQPGDIFLLLTDGIEEAASPEGSRFGRERIFEILRENRDKPAAEIIDVFCAAACDFSRAEEQKDDMTAVLVKMLPIAQPDQAETPASADPILPGRLNRVF